MEEAKKVSESSMSFWSLPYDIIVNCLARVSRFYYPTLSLVSKSFRSILASHELEATRSRMGITENYNYLCLNLPCSNPKPCWFTLSPIPKQHKLIPIPSFPYNHQSEFSTIVSSGSEIYIVGGYLNGNSSRRVFLLRSYKWQSHQWHRLPNMHVARQSPASEVINGKLYVIGGCCLKDNKNWGEVYDPYTQIWERLLPTTLDLTIQKSLIPGSLVMNGKVYAMDGMELYLCPYTKCLVVVENVLCRILVSNGKLFWCDAKISSEWNRVLGLEGFMTPNSFSPNHIALVASSGEGRRVTLWWKRVEFPRQGHLYTEESETEIWCAEISLERYCGSPELWGFVEWSKRVFAFDGCVYGCEFFLHYAVLTY